jgi:glyoxylase-like metal-dependent hydrolase (beta-lactamase superfamily II)
MKRISGRDLMSEEVCKNVWLVGGSELTDPGDCMVYIVKAGEQVVLVDAGTGRATERLMTNIAETGVDSNALSSIILTHCHIDHIGGTNEIRQHTGAKVYAHEKDAEAIEKAIPRYTAQRYYGIELDPIPVDMKLSGDKGEFDFAAGELSWIHTPGHTPGSIAVVYESPGGEKVLFGQDIHGPFEPEFDSNIADWRESMKKLLVLEPDILCEGHFGIFQPAAEVLRFIEGYLKHYA